MPICIVGSGGREFSLAHKLYGEGHLLFAVPGNDGIKRLGLAQTFPLPKNIDLKSIEGFKYVSEIVRHYKENALIVIGPEDPLDAGIVDYLNQEGYLVFGPRQAATKLESSKCWSSEFMKRNGVPAPNFYNPTTYQDALDYTRRREYSVIKGNRLAQGKGVTIARTYEEAERDLYIKMIEGKLGGPRVNIQDYIDIAYELSAMAIVDVRRRNGSLTSDYKILLYSMDHKPLYDNDKGPNTGGMGAVAPLPLTEEMKKRVRSEVIERTIEGFMREGIEFTGCLYPALAVDKHGDLYVFEYNIRFGDPEIQVVLDSMDSSLHDYLMATTVGKLNTMPEIRWRDGYSTIVNLVSRGYPESPDTGFSIEGLDNNGQLKDDIEGVIIIHAGTKAVEDGNRIVWKTDGGRVLGVRARELELPLTISKSYQGVQRVSYTGRHLRNDIGKKALELSSVVR